MERRPEAESPSRPLRVLVTGAAGMLGRAVVQEFGGAHEVLPLLRSDCDLTDPQRTRSAFAALAPDHVVHCAAWTDVDGCETDPEKAHIQNAFATRNVVLATQRLDAALIYISTDYVFDGRQERPYGEDDPPSPVNVYGRTKRDGEAHVWRHLGRGAVVRTSWLFGPGGRHFVRTIAGRLLQGQPLQVVQDQVGSPTYTLDLARALRSLAESELYGVYHVTNTGQCSWFEFAREIEALLGTGTSVLPCRSEEYPRPAPRPRHSVLDNGHYRLSGLPALRPWKEALRAYVVESRDELQPRT